MRCWNKAGRHERAPDSPAVREEIIWDRFVDALDRAGQTGNAADVVTPTALHGDGGRCSWEQAYRLIPLVQFCTTDNGALASVSTIALSRKRWPFRVTA